MPKIAGLLFFLAGAIIVMGIITSEIFYPTGYSIAQSMISTLGSSPPPSDVVKQPSADIFDLTLITTGILILIGTFLSRKTFPQKLVFALFMMGLGVMQVGMLPAYHAQLHPIAALIAFSGGGVAAILSSKVTQPPFSYLSIAVGIITLGFLILGTMSPALIVPILGPGGTERWVAYPLMIWLTGFGGYLMSSQSTNNK